MGQPKGKEKGTREDVNLRVGVDIDGFIGVHTNRDPGAIPRRAFQRARNVRLDDGMPCERGGQSKVITSPIDSPWDGLYDAGCGDGGLRLYMAGLSFDSLLWAIAAESLAPSIFGYRTTWNPVVSSLAATDPYAGYRLRFFKAGSDIYAIGYENETLHFFSVQLGVGSNPDILTLTPIDESSYASNDPSALEFGGSIFFATTVSAAGGGTDLGVYRYTPGSGVALDFNGTNAVQYIGENGSDLYTVSGSVPFRFLKRNGGLYTLLAYPADLDDWESSGSQWSPANSPGAKIGATVYFVGMGPNGANSDVLVVSLAGTTVAYQEVLSNIPIADAPVANSLVSFNGLLYWLQKRGATVVLAQSNGASYSQPADFTALFGIPISAPRNMCLVAGSGCLYLIASASFGSVEVYKSAGTDASSWTLLGAYTLAANDLKPNPGSGVALQ